jgi:hypothetical protein
MPSSISLNVELPGLSISSDAQTPEAALKLLAASHWLVKSMPAEPSSTPAVASHAAAAKSAQTVSAKK